jgi:hypothetical protein
MYIVATTIIAVGVVFFLGYHIGNQLGRTAHIRKSIRQAREQQVTARIHNS